MAGSRGSVTGRYLYEVLASAGRAVRDGSLWPQDGGDCGCGLVPSPLTCSSVRAGREGGRGETGVATEEAAEIRGIGEPEMDGHSPGIPAGTSQQPPGFEQAPLVDDLTHPLAGGGPAARLRVRTEQPSNSA